MSGLGAEIKEVSRNIYQIDNQLFSIPGWGSVYFINEEKKALIECGPTTSIPPLLEGLSELGVSPEEIDYLVVTHIHLDHSGGAGVLLKYLPNAQVIVHPKGSRHLTDPSKLVAAATATRGSEIIEMHGEVLPVETRRIRTIQDGETISLGEEQTLTFMDTPGHAPHHICIHESRNGGLFTGDALALYNAECNILLPFHPPTQFDLEQCLGTLDKLKKVGARKIYYSHFGVTNRVNEHIERARKKLLEWDEIIREAVRQGNGTDLTARLMEHGLREIEPMKNVQAWAKLYDYFLNHTIPMAAEGHAGYYRKILDLA